MYDNMFISKDKKGELQFSYSFKYMSPFNYCVIWCLLGKDSRNNMSRPFYIKDEHHSN